MNFWGKTKEFRVLTELPGVEILIFKNKYGGKRRKIKSREKERKKEGKKKEGKRDFFPFLMR